LFATSGREDHCHNLFQQNPGRKSKNTKTTEKKEVHRCSRLASASTKPNLQSYRKKKTKSTHTKTHSSPCQKKKRERERESSLPRRHLSGLQKRHKASLKLPQALEKLKKCTQMEFLQRGTPTQDQTSLSSIYGSKTRLGWNCVYNFHANLSIPIHVSTLLDFTT
jgi:hypothetical protein